MMKIRTICLIVIGSALLTASPAYAGHKLRKQGESVAVAKSALAVTPTRDWNQLAVKPGKQAETWTLDGEQLNDVTFFGGISAGSPLVKERNKKTQPLPKFTASTLLVEVPELLERTYRTYKDLAAFTIVSTEPAKFVGTEGVQFTYEFTDADELTRRGEGHAAIIGGKLYMITFDAPRLNYYEKGLADYRALVSSARLQ